VLQQVTAFFFVSFLLFCNIFSGKIPCLATERPYFSCFNLSSVFGLVMLSDELDCFDKIGFFAT